MTDTDFLERVVGVIEKLTVQQVEIIDLLRGVQRQLELTNARIDLLVQK